MTEARGEIFDLGYRGYDGPREGRVRAYKALWVNGVRTALGIGRSWGAKVMPALLLIAVISPALVAVIVASLAGPEDIISHSDYYGIVSIVLLLFSAIVAPELLCPDRRDRVLGLYLVRPLTTTDYVAARWLAFLSVTLPLVLAGQVVLFVGLTLAASDPVQYVEDQLAGRAEVPPGGAGRSRLHDHRSPGCLSLHTQARLRRRARHRSLHHLTCRHRSLDFARSVRRRLRASYPKRRGRERHVPG